MPDKKKTYRYNAAKRAAVMSSLVECENIAEVCRLHNVSRPTVDRWRKDYAEELRLAREKIEGQVAAAAGETDPTEIFATRIRNGIDLGLAHITSPKSWANANIAQSASALGVLLDKLKALNGGRIGREIEIKFDLPEEYKR